ncbi:ribose 5-phosphate isomerase B [Hydrogenivirga sp. 128-5-R1-1]|uniref:ribose 5-phosphate isomerase B n=1 Tax=Hydrogenivirga sp. 128-5-R1-1 TaxID=392423 RepID=UPI00015EF7D1|nr:ribose 5-phosphate isomerase B [Hydrogenivirga sp. 128-5-R1-1]EDP74951.1 ribose 5-phosphate isomerase B [Hydrogenivirga sp. 128-5-R1-1]
MKIAVGSDHAGFPLKERIKEFLLEEGHEVIDFGTTSEESTHYPLFARDVSLAVQSGEADRGILVCGTGIGMSITANKFRGIRAALCFNEYMARMSRLHNDANVLCLGDRVIGEDLALAIVEVWLKTPFEGGRHAKRVELIANIEREHL